MLVFCFTLGDHEGMDPDLPPRVSFRDFTAEAVSIRFSLPLRHSFWKRDDAQGPLDVNLLESTARREDDV